MASLDDTEDVALDFGAEDEWRTKRNVRYPLAAVFHLLFKVLAYVIYFLHFGLGFITSFVIIVLLISMDFWTVKNVSGRLLVGLRWWNQVDEDGRSHWVFESRKKGSRIEETNTESRIFWLGIIIAPVIWFLGMFSAVIQGHLVWLMIPVIGFCLGGSNLYGYLRCKVGSKQHLSSFATQFLGRQLLRGTMDSMNSQSQAT